MSKGITSLKCAKRHHRRTTLNYKMKCMDCGKEIVRGDHYWAKSGGYEWCEPCFEALKNKLAIIEE